jgi:hypothetical protein
MMVSDVGSGEKLMKQKLMHERMGHLNMRSLYELDRKEVLDGLSKLEINLNNNLLHEKCKSCIKGKQHRKKFGVKMRVNEMITSIMDKVSSDTAGPIKVHKHHIDNEKEIQIQIESIHGHIYYNIIIDEWSGKVFFKSFKTKDEIAGWVMQWCKDKQVETGKILKQFHSDNGTEFTSNALVSYLRNQGTKIMRSEVDTPQHNGKAERMNRTLSEMARTMLMHAGLSNLFWVEAFHVAVYIRNLCAAKYDNSKSVNEMWSGVKSSVKHIRVFGCDAHVHVSDDERKKMDVKSWKGIFVGYS